MTALITKTTSQGKQIIIAHIDGEFVATLDGTEIARHVMPGMYVPAKQLHIFAGKVGMSKSEGQIMIDHERAYAATIVVEMSRADLVAEYHGLVADQDAAYNRAHDRQDARAMAIRESYEAKIEAAAQAIRDYDATHPEEAVARKAERAESIERNRWM